jgi:2-amino-4-hydroxy-6-hydroxymethyldihydropteridine diphosphokinase
VSFRVSSWFRILLGAINRRAPLVSHSVGARIQSILSSTSHAYVSLGSNLGDRAGNLLLAVRGMLDAGLAVARLSSIYETEPVEVADAQRSYLNMVAELSLNEHAPTPEQVLARLLRIEYILGRRRERFHAARTIDLDLLLYADAHSDTDFLKLPHPRLHARRFVLTPLAELAPDAEHPTLGRTFKQLLAEVRDDSRVGLWSTKDGVKDEG